MPSRWRIVFANSKYLCLYNIHIAAQVVVEYKSNRRTPSLPGTATPQCVRHYTNQELYIAGLKSAVDFNCFECLMLTY